MNAIVSVDWSGVVRITSGGNRQRIPIEIFRFGAEIFYIGKATSLRSRVGQPVRFGGGSPVGHWGGRYLWQLEGAESFIVAWRTIPQSEAAEREMIEAFRTAFGALPFANYM